MQCLKLVDLSLAYLYCYAVNLTFGCVTLNICSISAAMRCNYVPNVSEIEQSAAELLRFEYLTL